jgi:VanZ family protein
MRPPSIMQTRRELLVATLLLIAGIVWILIATLSPFTFEPRPLTLDRYIESFGRRPGSLLDFPRNIILFAPFGFALAALLNRGKIPFRRSLFFVVLTGFLLTMTVESLQIFLPRRVPTFADVLANTLGSAAGAGCLRLWQNRASVLQRFGVSLTPSLVVGVLAAWMIGATLFSWLLMHGLRPGGWNKDYRLALGNEMTADRPWSGSVHDLLLLDRAVDGKSAARLLRGEVPSPLQKAIVAAYPLNPNSGLAEKNQALPQLVSQPGKPLRYSSNGVSLQDGMWLLTTTSVATATERFNRSGQFTIGLTCAPSNLAQDGPARIVTISADPFYRNVTLGQARKNLALRWRSFLTRKNGMTPELQFPGVFNSTASQRIVVTCDGTKASVYTMDGVSDATMFLRPEVGFAALMHEENRLPVMVGSRALWPSTLLLYTLIFFPIGFALSALIRHLHPPGLRAFLTVTGILSPALLIESFVAIYQQVGLRTPMIALGSALTILGLLSVAALRALTSSIQMSEGAVRDDIRSSGSERSHRFLTSIYQSNL